MLLQRVLTAIPLALFVLWMILFQPTEIFDYLLYAFGAIAAYEWAKLSGLEPVALRILYASTVTMLCVVIIERYLEYAEQLLLLATLWWLYIGVRMFSLKPVQNPKASYLKMMLGMFILPVAIVAMHLVHLQDKDWLLYGMMLVWVADIGAYFSGKKFGKTKLAPAISPGKTLEGLIGAIIATTIFSAIASFYFDLDHQAILLLLALSFVLTLISVVGDLYESILKREYGVKDSGRILPGHGGILDRIDSVLAVMPVFALGLGHIISTTLVSGMPT